MQNLFTVNWDLTLTDLVVLPSNAFTRAAGIAGLVTCAVKFTTGAPTATAGKFIPGATIQHAIDGGVYQNTGSTASPVWSLMETSASGFTLPVAETDSTTTTGTSFLTTMAAITTGIARRIVASLMTTGIGHQVVAAIAVLTTGRYYSANNGATEVWGIGLNGHMISTVSAAPPTIAVTTPNGISAAAITAGGTDMVGVITTTGTQDGSGDTVLDVTFGKTYTVPPKFVMLSPANAAGAKTSPTTLLRAYVSARSATGFTITIPEDTGTPLATPSFMYNVIG